MNDDIIKFSTRHINEVFIAENDKGRIDTIYRKFNISARAAIQKFGDVVHLVMYNLSLKKILTKK